MSVIERYYTADDLWQMAQSNTAQRYELVKGQLVEMPPAGDIHTVLVIWIAHLLLTYVVAHDLGEITGPDGGYILASDPYTVRAPDVGFIAKARLQPMTGKYYPFAPDLAVEVVSPNDAASAIDDTVIEYFSAGTRLVWVIYPKSKTVHVFCAANDVRIL